jgi:hypothetical protein
VRLLDWIGEHPVLTVVLCSIVGECIVDIVKAFIG